MRNYLFFLLAAILFFYAGEYCFAQETILPIDIKGRNIEHLPEQDKIIASGGIEIKYDENILTAEEIVIDTKTKIIRADKGAVLKQGENSFTCKSLEYEIETKKANLTDVKFSSPPWFGSAKKVSKVGVKEYRIIDGFITTCDLDKVHYRINAGNIKIILDEKVTAKNAYLSVKGVPILFIPYYAHNLKDKGPSFSLAPGASNDWGWYALSAWKYYFSDANQGFIHMDWRQKKGFASGVSHKYKSEELGDGLFRIYYMDERDKAKARDIRTEKERYRAQLRHIKDIGKENQFVLEFHKLSDADFNKEYFYLQEYQRDSLPESYASFTSSKPNYTLNFLGQKRVNRSFEQVEYLPKLALDIKTNRIKKSPIFYRGKHTLANLTKKYSAPTLEDEDANRFDSLNKLHFPIKFLESGRLTPYAGEELTFYSKDKFGRQGRLRASFLGGVDLSMKFYRQFDVDEKFLALDLDKLRHVITPSVNYSYAHSPTISKDTLSQFDAIDSLQRENKVKFSIENKLQAKRDSLKKNKKWDLFNLILSTEYLFKEEEGSRFKDILADLEIAPFDWLAIESDAKFDAKKKDFQTFNFDLILDNKDKWQLGIGNRYWRNESNELTLDGVVRVSPKWKLGIYQRYEFQTNTMKQQQYFVRRDLHCWQVEAGVDFKERGEQNFWVKFSLTEFPDLPFKFETRLSKPKYELETTELKD